jgi:CBS domain containing-hemolysin-like protein
MTDLTIALRLLGGFGLLLMNGFFVTTEFAMTRVRQFPEEEFTGHRGLERAWQMTEELEIHLSGCQVGITIASVGLGVVAEPALATAIDPLITALSLTGATGAGHTTLSVILALVIINIAHIIVGEQTPTYLGVEQTKTICRYLAPALYYWSKLMSPVIRFADWTAKGILSVFGITITRAWADEEANEMGPGELRREMGSQLAGLGLSPERREEVLSALDIGRMTAMDVMVEREDIITLSTENGTEENIDRMNNHHHSRFPLIGESLDEFQGIIYTPTVLENIKELLNGEYTFEEIATHPMTISAEMNVSDLIDRFQSENQELALVTDDSGVTGLVTSTDALEAITGELEDPFDADDTADSSAAVS